MEQQRAKPWYGILYVQVLIAVALGILVGALFPDVKDRAAAPAGGFSASQLKPLGDGFINLVKMLISPIIFCTVVHGIASLGDLKKLGRIGLKTLLYFETVSTIALGIGLLVANLLRPGDGFNIDPSQLDAAPVQHLIEQGKHQSAVEFLLHLIPTSFLAPLATGDLLQTLLIAILTALAISALGERGKPAVRAIEAASHVLFGVMQIIVRLAPVGVFGAMAFTVGSYGLESLRHLLALMGCFYLSAVLFVVVVLGLIARALGFSIFRLIGYLKEELLLVLGTSSSETALPGLIKKMERAGCREATVGLVVPTGYSFNLDGTNIYLSMAVVFLAQATNTPLTLGQQLSVLVIAMLTSKGSAAVTGGGFITLAATLAAVPSVPISALAIIYGIDRFMSECRALTNLIGNAVATLVISRWEGELQTPLLRDDLFQQTAEPTGAP
ncbi:MAG TPA: C4-dicarboxylate transporter DctA [Pirellulales bacterium]|jgi:aerobic C4-dicarboxylate transport protein|nr:C4-dicarboxylate transporter DctA [Pirellulales bacterium]